MKIDEFALWFFDVPLTEGCFIMCPFCYVGSCHTDWMKVKVFCDQCDDHPAIVCPDCHAVFDFMEDIIFEVAPKFP